MLGACDFVKHALVSIVLSDIDFARLVLTKGADSKPGKEQLLGFPRAVDLLGRARDPAGAEIGIEVDAFEIRIGLPPVTVAASYRAIGNVMVLGDR